MHQRRQIGAGDADGQTDAGCRHERGRDAVGGGDSQPSSHRFGKPAGRLDPRAGDEQRKFLSADAAGDHFGGADCADMRAEGGDDRVADRVTMTIVDLFKTVEVGDH